MPCIFRDCICLKHKVCRKHVLGILRVLIYGDQKHEVVCFLLDVACILCINIDVLKNEDCIKVGKNFMTSSV